MAKTKSVGGRKSREVKLKELSKRIDHVASGAYLAELRAEYRVLDLQEALSEARGIMGTGGVRMVGAMLSNAQGNAAALDRLRDYLRTAGIKPSLISRIVSTAPVHPEPSEAEPEPGLRAAVAPGSGTEDDAAASGLAVASTRATGDLFTSELPWETGARDHASD